MDGPVSVQRGGHGLHVEGWRSRLLQIYEKRFLEGLFIKKVFLKKIKIKSTRSTAPSGGPWPQRLEHVTCWICARVNMVSFLRALTKEATSGAKIMDGTKKKIKGAS
jgi:hypothetical protein